MTGSLIILILGAGLAGYYYYTVSKKPQGTDPLLVRVHMPLLAPVESIFMIPKPITRHLPQRSRAFGVELVTVPRDHR